MAFMAYAKKTFSDDTIAAYEFGFRPEEPIHGVFVASAVDPAEWHVYGADRVLRTAEVTHRKGAAAFAETGEWPAWIAFNS
ncbi:hypothetical protein [Agreia sp. VKM Ac-1783]|uniref:hypothetical protein n=1 Tax=Agreia sp. VKM Ac-1783 TaxID=1938889 RepID=UPI000A2ACCD1|nr:hypothetical protein [Agreia sp. VKM Ac-1783]SMQ75348.1 hypothetical protein SAMN06295943_3484 [Agreia sp. VKM Ac-1783]